MPSRGLTSGLKKPDSLLIWQASAGAVDTLVNGTWTLGSLASIGIDTAKLGIVQNGFLCPRRGYYRISSWFQLGSATGRRGVTIYRNGTTIGGDTVQQFLQSLSPAVTNTLLQSGSAIFELQVGDLLQVMMYQDSGGNLVNLVSGMQIEQIS